jgi:hypothetical protein
VNNASSGTYSLALLVVDVWKSFNRSLVDYPIRAKLYPKLLYPQSTILLVDCKCVRCFDDLSSFCHNVTTNDERFGRDLNICLWPTTFDVIPFDSKTNCRLDIACRIRRVRLGQGWQRPETHKTEMTQPASELAFVPDDGAVLFYVIESA